MLFICVVGLLDFPCEKGVVFRALRNSGKWNGVGGFCTSENRGVWFKMEGNCCCVIIFSFGAGSFLRYKNVLIKYTHTFFTTIEDG